MSEARLNHLTRGISEAALPEEIAKVVSKLQEPIVACGVATSQFGALADITGPQECVSEMRDAYKRRRDIAVEILKKNNAHTYTPMGAFYLMIDVTSSALMARTLS
jgi:aspartate aminotransferase